MTTPPRVLKGIELRYVLTHYIAIHGPKTVAELLDLLAYHNFDTGGRPSKVVSDALRWEIAHGRVRRRGWGRYGPGVIPRSTEYRIVERVITLRKEAGSLRLRTN
jgi:hypothetical protein